MYYAGALTLEETHAAIKQSFVMVNSSKHEGMCTAILEVLTLQNPCLQDIVVKLSGSLLYIYI